MSRGHERPPVGGNRAGARVSAAERSCLHKLVHCKRNRSAPLGGDGTLGGATRQGGSHGKYPKTGYSYSYFLLTRESTFSVGRTAVDPKWCTE